MSVCMNRFLEIKQQWTEFGHLNTNEKAERAKDIQNLLDEIERKLHNDEHFEKSKSEVFPSEPRQEHHNYLIEVHNYKKCAISVRIYNKMKKTESKMEIKKLMKDVSPWGKYICSYFKEIQNTCEMVERQAVEKMNAIKEEVEEDNENCIAALTLERKGIKETKEFIEKNLKECQQKQIESLDELCKSCEDEISNIYTCIQEKRINRRKREEKLKCMTENLLGELTKVVEREEKQGKIAYDCLLKLMDEFHSQIKRNY